MRTLAALAGSFALATMAGAWAQPAPPRLEPIPEPPPPRIGIDNDSGVEPGVILRPEQQIEETVIDGKRAIRVINPQGVEYYLVEELGDTAAGQQNPHDSRVRVPRWVIFRW